jgi:plastocyanin
MQRRKRTLLGAALVAVAGVLVLPAVVVATPDSSATVQFGNDDKGSPFPPPTGHDASGNAKFNLIPRTAVISAPGTVTFEVVGHHQVAVYEAGTTPADIAVPAFPPNFFINDPDGRIGLGPESPPGSSTFTQTFTTPGRYLVLCNITPHFAFFDMYGWVEVQ